MTTAVNLGANYFELFGITAAFNVPLESLAQSYRQLQHQVHPDKFSTATATEKRLSVQQSSWINQAYQTLRDPLERAKYLLSLHGREQTAANANINDPAFLLEQMELREALADIDHLPDPLPALLALAEQVDAKVQRLYRELEVLFPLTGRTPSDTDLTQARDRVNRLQFLSKLQSDISDKEHRLI